MELGSFHPKSGRRCRHSATTSKERKALQILASSLSAKLSLIQRDTDELAAQNTELKLRLQIMEQQVHLKDVLNEGLKEEIQHLKVLTREVMPNGGSMNFPTTSDSIPEAAASTAVSATSTSAATETETSTNGGLE